MGYWRLLFFASHILIGFLSLSNGQPDFRYLVRGDNGSTSMFESNKNTLLSSFAPNIGRNGFYSSSFGQNSDRVNAIALCRGDVELDICRSCVNDSTHKLVQVSPNYLGAIGWYDNCMLRYSNFTILHQLDMGPPGAVWSPNNLSDSEVDQFNQAVRTLLDRLREQAKSGDSLRKFASGSTSGPAFQTIYALSQCTPDLSNIQCDTCLDGLAKEIPRCCNGRQGARILRPSCNLRFETDRFYNETPPGKENRTTRTIYTIVFPIVVSVIIIVFICIFMIRKRKQRKPKQKFVDEDDIIKIETLQYDLDTIRTATNNFADSNKLGQGGFGAVYKGTLPNEKEVAVKRLSIDSAQGEHEFKNEVLLLVKLQHRNLVRLLGFCLEGTERLLVYEFLPNASLDHFIFDPVKRAHLDWDMRYKIIRGVAKGLLYLHEDSQHRIIHRDLKASNILLDAEMNPKIADFGMARLFVLDETQGSTSRIAGTYGYMAPEYAMHGQFSVKSDVFSFGVLVLEIVSGQKNNLSRQGENVKDLLSYAWKNWQDRTTSNLIDPKMIVRSESNQDIIRCIHIGLLCVQENVADRPTMASVLLMLNSLSFTLAVPLEPAFFAFNNSDFEMPSVRGYSSSATQSNQSEGQSGLCSVNEASITELYPR